MIRFKGLDYSVIIYDNAFIGHFQITIVDRSIIDQDENRIIQAFVYSVNDNKFILYAIIKYILETKRFDGPTFQVKESWSMHSYHNGTNSASFLSINIIIL